MSPPISCIEWWDKVPIPFATSAFAKLLELVPVILNILVSQKTNNSSRNTLRPVITSPIIIDPAFVSKSSSVYGPENTSVDVALDIPA